MTNSALLMGLLLLGGGLRRFVLLLCGVFHLGLLPGLGREA